MTLPVHERMTCDDDVETKIEQSMLGQRSVAGLESPGDAVEDVGIGPIGARRFRIAQQMCQCGARRSGRDSVFGAPAQSVGGIGQSRVTHDTLHVGEDSAAGEPRMCAEQQCAGDRIRPRLRVDN